MCNAEFNSVLKVKDRWEVDDSVQIDTTSTFYDSEQINGRQRLNSTSQIRMPRIKELMFPSTKKRLDHGDMWNSVHKPDFPNKRSVDNRQKHHGISTFIDLEI